VFSRIRERLTPGRGRVLAGVHALLDALGREPAWVVGLLTGNMTQMARIKLGHFGLWDRFAFGAFGEQAGDRNGLARELAARVLREHGLPPARCVVVGDTEHDIECARAAGMKVIAVASGFRSLEQLAPHRPDLLLGSLEDTARVVEWGRALESAPRPA
jgi:phosphoglycolate phosphatase-like HAD superfamily hydrolase